MKLNFSLLVLWQLALSFRQFRYHKCELCGQMDHREGICAKLRKQADGYLAVIEIPTAIKPYLLNSTRKFITFSINESSVPL